MKKAVLITGGAGYIGSHAVKMMLDQGYKVIVFDNLFRGYQEAIDTLAKYSKDKGRGELLFFKGDLQKKNDIKKVLAKNKVGGVMHFAALCLVNESMEQPALYFENNVMGTLNLLEAMRAYDVKNIIFSSTCAIYGESKYLPMDEKHPVSPMNPYGESKLMAENIIRWYTKLHGFNSIIFRYFNVCGADSSGLIGDSKKPSQLLVQNAVRGAMGIEKFYLTCGKVDTPDKTPIRDYIDVEDLVNAHMLAYNKMLEVKKSGFSEVYNLGNGKGWSVLEIVREVESLFDVNLDAKIGEVRKGEYASVYADVAKARKDLGWVAKKSLRDSVESLRLWYNAHPMGWVE